MVLYTLAHSLWEFESKVHGKCQCIKNGIRINKANRYCRCRDRIREKTELREHTASEGEAIKIGTRVVLGPSAAIR